MVLHDILNHWPLIQAASRTVFGAEFTWLLGACVKEMGQELIYLEKQVENKVPMQHWGGV